MRCSKWISDFFAASGCISCEETQLQLRTICVQRRGFCCDISSPSICLATSLISFSLNQSEDFRKTAVEMIGAVGGLFEISFLRVVAVALRIENMSRISPVISVLLDFLIETAIYVKKTCRN